MGPHKVPWLKYFTGHNYGTNTIAEVAGSVVIREVSLVPMSIIERFLWMIIYERVPFTLCVGV